MENEFYTHWIWGENNLGKERQTYLINLNIGVSIRFNYKEAAFASFEEFLSEIADIQFIYGKRPDDEGVQTIVTEAWDYMVLEEEQLDIDLESMEDDEDDY